MTKKRMMLVFAGVVVLGGGGWGVWKHLHPAPDLTKKVATAKVEKGDIRLVVASSGRVTANQEVDVKCKAGGQVAKMPFDISDTVHAGDLLVEVDPIDEQRKVKQAEVQLAASQAKLASARENLAIAELTLKTDQSRAAAILQAVTTQDTDSRQKAERVQQLLAKKLVSQEECDTAQNQVAQAAADLQAAKIRLEELKIQEKSLELRRQEVALAQTAVDADQINLSIAQDRLRDTRVISPIEGVVSARLVQPGQIIASATNNVGGGTTLLTLSDLSRIFVMATVDETDIGRVQAGQKVSIAVDAFSGRPFPGEVIRIAVKGVNTSNVVTFDVQIEVTGPRKQLLKPEMTATVEILTAEKTGVLTLPLEAVVRKGRDYFADKVTGGVTATVPVTVGLADSEKIEIVSGLATGDTVSYTKDGDAAGKWSGKTPAGGPPRGMMMGMGGPPPRR